MKTCSTCKEIKPKTDFYKDKRTPDGLKYQCKKCHLESSIRTRDEDKKRESNKRHMRNARKINPDKFRERERRLSINRAKDKKYLARKELNNAVKRGDIIKPRFCKNCNKKRKITAHHDDYSKPLEVQWLCYTCHGKVHRQNI